MTKWQQHTYDVIERATKAITSTDDLPAAHAHLRDAAESIGRALGALENETISILQKRSPMSETPKKMIDERLDALTMNFELALQQIEAFLKWTEEFDRHEHEARENLLAGIAAYLRALRGNEDGGNHA